MLGVGATELDGFTEIQVKGDMATPVRPYEVTVDPNLGFVIDGSKSDKQTVTLLSLLGGTDVFNLALIPEHFVDGSLSYT